MLDALMKDTASVSFAIPEDPPGPPVLNVVTSTPRMMGVGVGLVGGLMQGTKRSGSKLYSVATGSVAGWNSSFCFGLVGPGSGSFCVRKGFVVQSHGIRKCDFQGKDMTCVFMVREQGDDVAAVYSNPCVDESKVPPEVRAEWRTKLATPKEWAVEFQAVENADSALATSEDIKDEASLLVKAERFRTPLKKRKEDDI